MEVNKVEDADIIVDNREPQRIKENLSSRGFSVSVENLGVGDYVWGDTAIERKTLNDFLSSLLPRKRKGPRIWQQAKGLSEEFEHPYIIISGTSISLQKKDLYKEKQIYGSIAALMRGFDIPVIRTETEREFVLLIESLYNRGEKKTLSRPYPSTSASSPHHQKVENALCQVPRIGIKTAQKILKKYGSLENLMDNLVNESEELEDLLSSKKKKNLEKVLLKTVKYYKGS